LAPSGKPLLRKDFIFHPTQVLETAETTASAILLMVRLTPDPALLSDLMATAEGHGLECVVEVFDPSELKLARGVGARLIQFNSRDLGSLKVDSGRIFQMALDHPPGPGEVYIAASGLSTPADLIKARDSGFRAVLIGTKIMAAADPAIALAGLLDGYLASRVA
jgi:indole-3-glycerol phosphate synthase